ncbi:MAG: M15 family metallopeptidase [Bacteroidales bacterium]|nr:M15 family metallopeptidase [Bacteroidales bacterium]
MDRKVVDWSRFEELADLMFQVASDQGVEIVWGGHWKTFVNKCHFELK